MFENIQSFTVKKASWTEAGMFALLHKHIKHLKTYISNNSFDLIHASVDILNWCIYYYDNFQIEDFVMISAKEAKDLLYTLFSENFITTTVSYIHLKIWILFLNLWVVKKLWLWMTLNRILVQVNNSRKSPRPLTTPPPGPSSSLLSTFSMWRLWCWIGVTR